MQLVDDQTLILQCRAGDQAAAVQATILLPEGAQAMLPKQPANFNWKGQQLVGITSPVGQASSPVAAFLPIPCRRGFNPDAVAVS